MEIIIRKKKCISPYISAVKHLANPTSATSSDVKPALRCDSFAKIVESAQNGPN